MDETYSILRGGAVSDDAQNDEKTVAFGVESRRAYLHNTDFQSVVDLNEEFINERNACDCYRVIVTVNPFCTNVLFNSVTEIVRKEGSSDVECVDATNTADLSQQDKLKIYGKISNVGQTDMVRNTEYTKDSVGYVYHPGMDIFNNHILRNKSYRIVNRPGNNPNRAIFNTINDKMRASNGSNIQRCCRREVTDTSMQVKHLYDHDDILSFSNGDAIHENLRENDGWFGFYNNSVIPSKNVNGEDMDISCAINNRNKCEFIDMYPDRTLFSLVPKYNKDRNRLEYNWNYTLTYPFENTTTFEANTQQGGTVTKDFSVVAEGDVNALVIVDTKYVILPNGVNALLFRSAVKHNLKVGDKFVLFFNDEDGNGVWHEVPHASIVNGLGDMDNNYHEFYFYTTDDSLLEEIFAPESTVHTKWDYIRDYFYKPYDASTVPAVDNDKIYNPGNLVNNNGTIYLCTSTVKGFTTDNFIPFNDYQFTEYHDGVLDIPSENDGYVMVNNTIYELYNHDIGIWYHDSGYDANRFIRNIVNNAFRDDDNPVTPVADDPNSLYRDYIQLRFAKTNGVYKSKYYVRKFKKLPNIKYGTDQNEPLVDAEFDSEYYKLAFSNTVYGDEVAQAVFFDSVSTSGIRDNLGRPLTDIYLSIFKTNNGYREWYCGEGDGKGDESVEYSHCFGPLTCGFDIFGLCSDTDSMKDKRLSLVDVHMICNGYNDGECTLGDKNDITVNDDWYYGDIAEFCPWDCTETVLADVCFRFNTAQRELDDLENSEPENYQFVFDEMLSDDYDYDGFVTAEYIIENGVRKREGYFYKPHKRIQLKGFGSLNQASHRNLLVGLAEPIQMDGLYIKVTCMSNHGIYGSHRVRFRDKSDSSNEIWLNVVSVIDRRTFVMEKIPHGVDGYMDWIAMCSALNNGTFALESENTDIPDYAYRISDNTYLWRRTTNAWDIDNETEGLSEYPFANGCLYIDNVYNLFVRRQDPYGCNRLYDGEPKTAEIQGPGNDLETESACDIVSPLPEEPVELYKDDSLAIC